MPVAESGSGDVCESEESPISISRNGQTFGPYPVAVVEKWIALGQLQRHDLGFRSQAEGWQPLGKLFWPENFSKAGTISGKRWAWIAAAVIGFVILIGLTSNLNSNRSTTSNPSSQPQSQQNAKVMTDFERGQQYFESGSYLAANDVFDKIGRDDPKYADAQEKLKLVKQKLAEQQQQEKKREALRKQYEKLCHSHLYLFQIEERLQRENFHMDASGFETAPDGSNGVRQYFSKTTSDGVSIKIWLQNAFSMSYYYCHVDVE